MAPPARPHGRHVLQLAGGWPCCWLVPWSRTPILLLFLAGWDRPKMGTSGSAPCRRRAYRWWACKHPLSLSWGSGFVTRCTSQQASGMNESEGEVRFTRQPQQRGWQEGGRDTNTELHAGIKGSAENGGASQLRELGGQSGKGRFLGAPVARREGARVIGWEQQQGSQIGRLRRGLVGVWGGWRGVASRPSRS